MPLLRISTAKQVHSGEQDRILAAASALVAKELGKPESYVMTQFEQLQAMYFGGSAEHSCYMQLKSIGLPESKTKALSASLSEFIEGELGIPPDRIYTEFVDVPRTMWGYNGSTFG